MRPISAKKLIKLLENNGFVLSRQKGSHRIYKNQNIAVTVPVHGRNKAIHIGTLMAIIKQSKIPKEKLSTTVY